MAENNLNIDIETLVNAFKELSVERLNDLLDIRDSSLFSAAWVSAREEIPEGEPSTQIKEVFIAVSQATNQHEIASYVADDLELILNAHQNQSSHPFVKQLAESYAQGQFPCETNQV
ncbi:hypothetical protein [Gimesia panareensis]|uniref:hypothetical protein n=1 Tax=Gimesia panareensis TaxID=2527978 RepID=UPI00118941EB|nr:hypothetical protein [Gimesia panareensis]QDU49450.1 hypothetical protein Pan110_17870 [Gimesia panareensis]